jgi:hypothetical protein
VPIPPAQMVAVAKGHVAEIFDAATGERVRTLQCPEYGYAYTWAAMPAGEEGKWRELSTV